MLEGFAPFLAWELTRWEAYGLFFILGSYVVATLSDLKHMSAQREFMDVWWAFVVIIAALQLHNARYEPPSILWLKWGLVVVLTALSHHRVGLWLRLATADTAAIAATAILLTPTLVLAYFLTLRLLAWPASRVLNPKGTSYPFMPVVTLTTLLMLLVALATGTIPA